MTREPALKLTRKDDCEYLLAIDDQAVAVINIIADDEIEVRAIKVENSSIRSTVSLIHPSLVITPDEYVRL